MATTVEADALKTAVASVLAAKEGQDRAKVFGLMDQPLKRAVKKELKRQVAEQPDESEGLDDLDWSKIGGSGVSLGEGKKPLKPEEVAKVEVTEKELDEVWASIEADDTSEYDAESAGAFDYQGFNAQLVLTQVMARGKAAGLSQKAILKDISMMCAASHKKGSINDKNYQKMKKAGQAEYDRLAGVYKLMKGGAKGMPPETLTISRMGPTFSAKILRLILDGKLQAKSFIGPMKSSSLHSVMQSQFFVSTLPSGLPTRSMDALVALCRAYSTDQTLALTQGKKPSVEEVWERQLNFVELTRNSDHPSEEARKSMCSKISWSDLYDKTATCVAAIKKVDNSFSMPSRADFLADIAKIGV